MQLIDLCLLKGIETRSALPAVVNPVPLIDLCLLKGIETDQLVRPVI